MLYVPKLNITVVITVFNSLVSRLSYAYIVLKMLNITVVMKVFNSLVSRLSYAYFLQSFSMKAPT